MVRKLSIGFLALWLFPLWLHAQTGSYNWMQFIQGDTSVIGADTSLNQPQQFFRLKEPFQDLGNYGTPIQSLNIPKSFKADTRFEYGHYSSMLYPEKEMGRYYSAQKPLTDIQFAQGGKRFLQFSLLFVLPLSKRWHVGVDLNRVGSVGFYQRQNNDFYGTRVFQSYHGKKNRYHLFVEALFNKGQNEESGGLKNDSLFASVPYRERILPVHLGSSSAKNELKDYQFKISQGWKMDSLSKWSIWHSMSYEKMRWRYTDIFQQADSGYYQNYLLRSDTTKDSLVVKTMLQEIGMVTQKGLQVGFRYRWVDFRVMDGNRNFQSVWLDASYPFLKDKKLNFITWSLLPPLAKASLGIGGYHAGNWDIRIYSNQTNKKELNQIQYSIYAQRLAPNLLDNHFSGNHFYWTNTFKNLGQVGLDVVIPTPKNPFFSPELNLKYASFTNWIYQNTLGYPTQYNTILTAWSGKASQTWNTKHWFLQATALFQKTSNKEVMPLPNYWLMGRLFWQGQYLGSPMLMQIGVQCWYIAPFRAMVWEPSTRRYLTQNIGNGQGYPMIDFYVNGQVRTFTFFLKLEHGLAGYLSGDYFNSPGYAMQGRVLRFGFSWRLFG